METKHFLSFWRRHLLNILNVDVQLWDEDGFCDKWIVVLSQVVTAHAVRVAVTNNLSANITGFLPIHCIYQLLRSRAFTKHKVSIKVMLRMLFWLCCFCSDGIRLYVTVFGIICYLFCTLVLFHTIFLHSLLVYYSILNFLLFDSFCWKQTSGGGGGTH